MLCPSTAIYNRPSGATKNANKTGLSTSTINVGIRKTKFQPSITISLKTIFSIETYANNYLENDFLEKAPRKLILSAF